jgi:hypothetical protein
MYRAGSRFGSKLLVSSLVWCLCAVSGAASAQEVPAEPVVEPPVVEAQPEAAPTEAMPDVAPAAPILPVPENQPERALAPPRLIAAPEVAAVAEGEPIWTFEGHGEYRLRSTRIDPLGVNDIYTESMQWTEQRLRLEGRVKAAKIATLIVQGDVLDGVLLGDNGQFGQVPSSNSGVSLTAKLPNLTRWDVGLRPGGNPIDRRDYVPVLRPAPLLDVNYLYADINIPVGLLRVGRQPIVPGQALVAHDGATVNRWGVSRYSDAVDRILFGTKFDEAYHVIRKTPNHVPDLTQESGFIFATFYDFMKQDLPQDQSDDLRQLGFAVDLRAREADWFGGDWKNLLLGLRAVFVSNDEFKTDVVAFPMVLEGQVGSVKLQAQYMHIRGKTTEIADGFAALTGKPSQLQDLSMHGARAVLDWKVGPATLTFEFDYASGDDDPRNTTPLTTFSFARDLNVGLLMFEHTLAYESARSVGVGLENLAGSDIKSFPLSEVQTDGRFTNAAAIFPQVYVELFESAKHLVHARAGVLMAWPAANGVVDPIMTTLAEDGQSITDDAVNFNGGEPGDYYGTEVDFQLGWKFNKTFQWVVEGAVLFPGSSLQDENGDAVNSFLVENRFVVSF